MAERIADVGYVAIKKETTPGTPVTPNVFVPYYKQNLSTSVNLIEDEPVVGNKFKRYQALQGIRSHKGSITIMAEPNSIGYFLDMLATKTSTTGSNPYTHSFGVSTTTQPYSYTLDISYGSQVMRFYGVQASKITIGWDGQKMVLEIDISALGSFLGREIASIATTAVTLDTTYDPAPTTGLVATDLVTVTKEDGSSTLNTTVASLTGTVATLGTSAAAFTAGDMVVLRPQTPSYSLLQPFLWGRTQFLFAATATAALSGAQTRLDPGTEISVMHDFQSDEGEARSGSFDPASLIRTVYDLDVKVKKYFDTPEQIKQFNSLAKKALIMRAYTGSTNQYELRATINNYKIRDNDMPTEKESGIYHTMNMAPIYDQTDAQGFDLKLINAVPTI
jgi:hypothetical protein